MVLLAQSTPRTTTTKRITPWLLGALAGLSLGAPMAIAQNDRINDEPTGWLYWFSRTTASIDADMANGYRPFAIKPVTSTTYDVIQVANSGEYNAGGMDVYYNVSTSTLGTLCALNGKRIIDLEVTNATTGTWTATVVNNSGSTAAPGWSWATNLTGTQLGDWQDANGLRPIDVDQYTTPSGTRYSVVGVPNTGTNAQGWWWYFNVSETQINDFLNTNGARLIDIDVVNNNPMRFNVVMVSQNTGGDWWYYGQTSSSISDIIDQTGGRLTCLERYTDSGGNTRFAIALVDNANAKTRRVCGIFDNALSNGTYGFKIQQVGGSVLGNLNDDFAYEPASSLKILHATYAIDRCASGLDNLASNILIRDTCNNDECPNPAQPCNSASEDLSVAIQEMLQQSDNNRTMEIELRYGRTNLNNFAAALGLTNTQINHWIGCGTPSNSFSATDACNIYEAIADNSLFSQTWQDQLYQLMNDKESQGWGVCPTLSNIIDQEAASTDLTTSEILDFRDGVNFASKGGAYLVNGLYYRSESGWARIPFKAVLLGQYVILPREYALASFVHGATSSTQSQVAYSADEELLREEVRAALQSWDSACSTPTINDNPDSVSNANPGSDVEFQVGLAVGAGNRTYQWQKQNPANNTWFNLINGSSYSGVTTSTMQVLNVDENDEGRYRVVVGSICGSDTSSTATLTVSNCDSVDFNNDTLTPDSGDLDDFLAVLAGGPSACSTFPNPGCNDLDFNNDGLFPDSLDLDAFISRLAGGACLQ